MKKVFFFNGHFEISPNRKSNSQNEKARRANVGQARES